MVDLVESPASSDNVVAVQEVAGTAGTAGLSNLGVEVGWGSATTSQLCWGSKRGAVGIDDRTKVSATCEATRLRRRPVSRRLVPTRVACHPSF